MTGEVIKSFLVGLGFDVDDSSLAKFNKSIATAAVRVTALYTSINVMAGAIVKGITSVSESFEDLGYELRIVAPAINKTLMLRQELLKAYSAAGINMRETVQNSIRLNMSIAKTRFALEAIYKSVGSRFFVLLTKQSDIFRQNLYKNMPKIQNMLERFVKFIFKAFEAVTRLGARIWSILTRVYDFFVKLDKATDGWSTIILGVIAAWKLLNLSFLATPLGMLLTGFVALLALWDDFQTFQEGGDSLFDWTKALPVINAVTAALKSMRDVWLSIVATITDVFIAFYKIFTLDFMGFFDAINSAAQNFIKVFGGFGNAVKNLFGGGNDAAIPNAQNAGIPKSAPIGRNVQNAQTNQNVQQQTTINVNGSADAQSIGKSVAGEQNRVNFNLVENFKAGAR